MAKSGSKANAKRKHVEEFQESEDRFRILADDAPVLIWVTGPDGSEFVNLAYREFVGVSREVDVLHFDWTQYVHPDDRERYLNAYLDCFRRQVPFNAVLRFRRHDGVYRWMKSIGKLRYTPSGEFYGYVGSTQDITDVKLLEDELLKARNNLEAEVEQRTRELRESEAMLTSIFRSAPTGIGVVVDRVIVAVNDKLCLMTGYSRDEMLGKNARLFYPSDEEYKHVGKVKYDMIAEFGVGEVETHWRRKDGMVINVLLSSSPIAPDDLSAGVTFTALDITKRKRAEESLKLTQFALDNFRDSAIWFSLDGRITYVNDEACRSLGYSREELLSKHIWDIDPDGDYQTVKAIWDDLKQRGSFGRYEQRHIAHDGRLFPIEVTACYVKYGEKEYIISFDRDITERKRAEEALRESEEKYRFLVENANSIIIRWDTQGILTFFNEYAEKLFGYSKNEMLGRNVVGTIVPRSESTGRDLAAIMEDIERYPDRYKSHVNENLCKNGDRVWIDWTNKAIQDENGHVVEILSVGNDITERKRIEEALRESEEMFRSLAESAKAGIILTRGDKFIYVNPETIKDLGYTEDELLSMYFLDVVHPDSKELVQSLALRMLRGLSVPSTLEIKVMTKAGETLWEELSPTLIDYKGEPTILATAFNITKRKRAEEDLKSAKQQAELYLDLMGHDINNMHQIALGYLELAKDLPPGEVQAEFMDKSIGVLQRSTTLIGNVRKLQKLHDGLFQTQEVDVGRVLVDIQSEYAVVSGKTITLNMNEHDRCIVHANDLLHDVFSNLVNNAVKHTGDGTQIIVGLNVIGDNGRRYCRVAVEDNGPGIPDDYKERIFNRMHKGTARGMGLGLYLVKSLVDSYGGRVWVDDRVQGDHTKGARFVVMLPAVDNRLFDVR